MVTLSKNLLSNTESVLQYRKDLEPIVKALNSYEWFLEHENVKNKAIELINKYHIPLGICVITTSKYNYCTKEDSFSYYILYNRMMIANTNLITHLPVEEAWFNSSLHVRTEVHLNTILEEIKSGKYDFKTDYYDGAFHYRFNPFEPHWGDIVNIFMETFVDLTIINN